MGAAALLACGPFGGHPGPGPGSTPGPGGDGSSSGGKWAEYVSLPELDPNADLIDPESLRVNNQGLYVGALKSDSDLLWVYRLDLDGPTPEWYVHKHPSLIHGFQPSRQTNEKDGEFGIFFHTLEKYGFVTINSGTTPAQLEEDTPKDGNLEAPRIMLSDHSPSANQWAFFELANGWKVKRREPTEANNFVDVVPPWSLPVGIVEPDDDDAIVWIGTGKIVRKVGITGSVDTIDLSTVASLQSTDYVRRIRVKDDVAWVQCGTKIFRIRGPSDVSVFTELTGQGALVGGGSFAVDGSAMYTTDGKKIDLALGTETNLLPPQPTTTDQQVLFDHIKMTSDFQSSLSLEVSTDALDPYVYTVASQGRILKVRK